jgi:hypothetical protein
MSSTGEIGNVFDGEVMSTHFYKPNAKFTTRYSKDKKKPTKGAFGGQGK